MYIDFLGLQAFISIADHGSFQRAAPSLNISQTALSHRMRKLEEYLGTKLMVRTTRQLTLTPEGERLLAKARPMMGEIATSLEDLRQHGAARQDRLAIGCLPTLAAYYLPPVLRKFSAAHPEVSLKIFDNSADEIGQAVEAGEAEFAITIVSVNRWDLETRPLLEESFQLVCRTDHRLARYRSVAWQELADVPLVRISSQAGNRRLIDEALARRRDALLWKYEVQHLATAVSLVRTGLVAAIAPRLAIQVTLMPELVAIPLRNPRVARTLGILSKRGHPFSPPAQALADLVSRHIKQQHERIAPARKRSPPTEA